MFKKIGVQATVSADPAVIAKADKLVLPGVGAFDAGKKNLEERGLIPVLDKRVLQDHTPILGVCLGMQLITQKSEEGALPGLGWIKADTVKFKFENHQQRIKVPHMGWNFLDQKKEHPIFEGLYENPRFYFVHSYYVLCHNEANVLATTMYGHEFASAIADNNIIGLQFHPEKSHKFGMQVLKIFAERF
jgi:glutamine amidotransferase